MSSMKTNAITIFHDRDLGIDEVLRVCEGAEVRLSEATASLLDERRGQVMAFVATEEAPAYGFNRGFGHNVKLSVSKGSARALQANLIYSHACGVGDPAPVPVVRGAMLLRAQSLARGHSGVRSLVVRQLVDCLNAGITPEVPRLGSVSASGDLAPLSHIALGLMGHGRVTCNGRGMRAKAALERAGIAPLVLDMKEGLALNNGVQYTTAIGVIALLEVEKLLKTACIATALSTQVMLGADTPFREDVHALRPHPGAKRVCRWLRDLMAGSPIRESHRSYTVDGEVQDPYNLRCAGQILGAAADLIAHAEVALAREMNSVTDNPLLMKATAENGWDVRYGGKYLGQFVDIVSGGHFHGMPIATELYGLLQAMAIMARLSNVRCMRYVDESRNKGLGSDLKWPGATVDPAYLARQATWSGMMIPEYVSAGLCNWIWGECMPSHLFSLSTDAGQEDHVSMAANLGLRVLDTLPRLAEALAMELAFAAQAAAIRKEMDHIPSKAPAGDGGIIRERYSWTPAERLLSPVCEAVIGEIHRVFPPVTKDRYMSEELRSLAGRVADGALLGAAERLCKLE
jgi:histidine ammonia-lyase